ncbi:MAG TPA: DUF4058 family protein [Planctomycetaceae bacterium]|nr:DUF4058 family protein [Planctomycetaceae bacterium]
MPMHNWKRVDAGICHAFHHRWISALSDFLNAGSLPGDYYALPEQVAAGFGQDVLTLEAQPPSNPSAGGTLTQPRPVTRYVAESATEFYRRKKSSVVVRHVSGDRMVAVLEIVSPGNKSTRDSFRAFVNKACELLEYRVHLLLVDPFPPTPRDPEGIHAAIWGEVSDTPFTPPADKPLTLVAYETGLTTRAYIEPFAVGDALAEMPLYLEPDFYVLVPLETTYATAFSAMPQRWRRVLEGTAE